MAKLTKEQKVNFENAKYWLDAYMGEINLTMQDYEFWFSRNDGVSVLVVPTGRMGNHYKIVASYCGEKDTFKKKIGFTECANKLTSGGGLVIPALDLDEAGFLAQQFMETTSASSSFPEWESAHF